jgi:hypothetical protein
MPERLDRRVGSAEPSLNTATIAAPKTSNMRT